MILHGGDSEIILPDYYVSLCSFICHEDNVTFKIFLLPKIFPVILLVKKKPMFLV